MSEFFHSASAYAGSSIALASTITPHRDKIGAIKRLLLVSGFCFAIPVAISGCVNSEISNETFFNAAPATGAPVSIESLATLPTNQLGSEPNALAANGAEQQIANRDGFAASLASNPGIAIPRPRPDETSNLTALAPAAPAQNAQGASLASLQPSVQVNVPQPSQAAIAPAKKQSFFAKLVSPLGGERPAKKIAKVAPKIAQQKIQLASAASAGTPLSNLFDAPSKSLSEADKVVLASVASMGGSLAANGLIRQSKKVSVNCFRPELLTLLRQVERKYGKKVIVTSGFRSKRENRRIGGARNSRHVYCDGADIQVKGVTKWQLAKYLRTLPGRGGVGTYCHTQSVHIDTYKVRDWNWRCRSRKKRNG